MVAIGPVLTALLGACAGTGQIQADIDRLKARQEVERQRLDQIQEEVRTAEARALIAKQEAEFQDCRAQLAAIRSEVALSQASCMKRLATHMQCSADVAKRKGNATLLGCLAGIGVAALTSGAATPIALAGCGAGKLAGPLAEQCGEQRDCPAINELFTAALSARGHRELPSCGGYLGFSVADSTVTIRGLRLKNVAAKSTAENAGLFTNDVLLKVAGRPTPDLASLREAVSTLAVGNLVELEILREGRRMQLQGVASKVTADGASGPSVALGVGIEEVTEKHSGVPIVSTVLATGAAAAAGLAPGDLVVAVDGQATESTEDLLERLSSIPPRVPVKLSVNRAGTLHELTALPAPREGRHGL